MNRTMGDFLLILFGRVGLSGLGFAASVIVFRVLGNVEAGRFAMCMAIVQVIAGCIGDPLDLAVLRRVPMALVTDRPWAIGILRGAFLVRLALGLCALAVLTAGSPWVATWLFQSEVDSHFVITAALGGLGTLLYKAILVYFQAEQRFPRLMALEAFLQITRISTILVLVAIGFLSARSGIFAYVTIIYLTFFAGLFCLPRELVKFSLSGFHELGSILHYAKWMLFAMAIAAMYERVNEFLIASFRGTSELGFYSAAMTWAMIPEMLSACLATVFHPRIVKLYEDGQFRAFHRAYLLYAIPLGTVAILLAVVLAKPLISLVYGVSYLPSVPAFRFLMVATLSWLVLTPLPGALVSLLAPRQILLITVAMFIVTTASGYFVIPIFGITGAAATFLVARLLTAFSLNFFAEHLLRRHDLGTLGCVVQDKTIESVEGTLDKPEVAGVAP